MRALVTVCLYMFSRDGDGDVQQWHRFKERLIGKWMLCLDSQSRLVVQGSAQLCIPHASLLYTISLVEAYVCVIVCVYECASLYMVRTQRISVSCEPSPCLDKWRRSSGEGYG